MCCGQDWSGLVTTGWTQKRGGGMNQIPIFLQLSLLSYHYISEYQNKVYSSEWQPCHSRSDKNRFFGNFWKYFFAICTFKEKKYALKVENRSVKRSLLCILENLFQVSFETETNYGSASIRDDACVNILLLPYLDSEYRCLTHFQRYSRLGGDCMKKVFCTCKMFPLTKAQWKISSFLTFSALDLLIKPLILLLQ